MKVFLCIVLCVAAASANPSAAWNQGQIGIPQGIVAAPIGLSQRIIQTPIVSQQLVSSPIGLSQGLALNGLGGLGGISGIGGIGGIGGLGAVRLVAVPVGLSGIGLNSGLGLKQGIVGGINPGHIGGGWNGLSGVPGLGIGGVSKLGGWSGLDGIGLIKKK